MSDRFTPRYFEIEQVLRARINELSSGDALPSDADLSRQFGVSRMTVRQAFQALVQEGLVERRPGTGTFVADKSARRQATVIMGFSNETRRKGRVPSSRVLESMVRGATEAEAAALGIDIGADVVSLRRVRLADGVPIVLESTVLRGECRAVLAYDLSTASLHQSLRDEGVHLARGQATILADRAGPDEADLLDIADGDPLLVERVLIFDRDDTPFESTDSRYAADRYELDVDFVVQA